MTTADNPMSTSEGQSGDLIKKLEYWFERCKSFPEETPGGREALLEIRHLVPEVVAALGRADRRVAEEREACATIAETCTQGPIYWVEGRPQAAGVIGGEIIADAIRSRSNGAEPEFLSAAVKNDGVHADACAPAGVEKVTQPLSQWQPIETAPDDGTPVLVVGGNRPEMALVGADGGHWRYQKSQGWGSPDYWMPLPTAPGSDDFLGIPNGSVNQTSSSPDTSPTAVGDEVEAVARIMEGSPAERWSAFHYSYQDVWREKARAVLSHLAKSKGRGVSPPGWKLMPAEPTPLMVSIGREARSTVYPVDGTAECYRAMYAAAPSPTVSQEVSIAPEALSEGGE